jgi:hypothetical protein
MLAVETVEAALEILAKASRDDTNLESVTHSIGQGVAILGVVLADEIAIREGHNATVGHHSVHVEDDGLDIG